MQFLLLKKLKHSLWFDWLCPVWHEQKPGLLPGFSDCCRNRDDELRLLALSRRTPLLRRRFLIIRLQYPVRLLGARLESIYCNKQISPARLLALSCLVIALGCTPYTHEHLLHAGKIESAYFDSGYFQHRLFRAASSSAENSSNRLHIYIGGDGQPWRTPNLVAADPTSKRAIMLENMLQDDSESVYIGRPCYYQVADARCRGNWWTHDRYHPAVVESLLKTVEQLAANHRELWLIGHSGGGTLAVLLGQRLDRPVKVVTVSANLDHQAWTTHHQYSPLVGSLNPSDDAARNPQMQALHWYATGDTVILPEWILAYCQQHQALCLPVSGGHNSNWPAQWPAILRCSLQVFTHMEATSESNAKTEIQLSGNRSHLIQKTDLPESCREGYLF